MGNNTVITTLKQHGQHITKPRTIVYEALSRNEPLSMRELAAICLPSIDKSSLYRTIALFEKLGIVQRLQIGWKYKLELSNEFQEHHHHMTCLTCGRTTPLPEDALLESQLVKLAQEQGFTPQDHQVEVRGVCQTCAES